MRCCGPVVCARCGCRVCSQDAVAVERHGATAWYCDYCYERMQEEKENEEEEEDDREA